ncbi:hypothetical protein ACQ4WZ_21605 [Janthinobacterium sp. HLS12-2]
MFHNEGIAQIGEMDGDKVTTWSGSHAPRDRRAAAPAQQPAPGALGEIRK